MIAWRIPLAVNALGVEAKAALDDVWASGRVTMGKKTREFERLCAEEYGVRDAVYVNSGSSANLLALAACQKDSLDAGDEVIVPAVTWATQIWPVMQLGMVPVLVDVDPETLAIDTRKVAEAISERTKAISVAHLLGNPAPMREIRRIAQMNQLELIEDCCEAMDVASDGVPVGTNGRFGTLSFYFTHHLSTIEGGMVLCREIGDAAAVRCLRSHGLTRDLDSGSRRVYELDYPAIDPRYLFADVGYNMRPTDLQAAIGIAQWDKRIEWRGRRKEIAAIWTEAVASRPDVYRTFHFAPGANPFAFPVMLRAGVSRAGITAGLEAAGIETRPIVAGDMGLQPAMRKAFYRYGTTMEGAGYINRACFYLGIYPSMSDEDVVFVADTLRKVGAA